MLGQSRTDGSLLAVGALGILLHVPSDAGEQPINVLAHRTHVALRSCPGVLPHRCLHCRFGLNTYILARSSHIAAHCTYILVPALLAYSANNLFSVR